MQAKPASKDLDWDRLSYLTGNQSGERDAIPYIPGKMSAWSRLSGLAKSKSGKGQSAALSNDNTDVESGSNVFTSEEAAKLDAQARISPPKVFFLCCSCLPDASLVMFVAE